LFYTRVVGVRAVHPLKVVDVMCRPQRCILLVHLPFKILQSLSSCAMHQLHPPLVPSFQTGQSILVVAIMIICGRTRELVTMSLVGAG